MEPTHSGAHAPQLKILRDAMKILCAATKTQHSQKKKKKKKKTEKGVT